MLRPIKAKPFGWPRKTRPSLDRPCARAAERLSGRGGRMLAARVEPKNGSIDCAGGTRCERKNQAAGFRANFTGAEVSYHLTSNAPYKGGVH